MGKLGDAIDLKAGERKGPTCDTAILLSTMDDEDRVDLEARLKDKSIAATIIQAKLDEFGYQVGVKSLRRHRNRLLGGQGEACTCPV